MWAVQYLPEWAIHSIFGIGVIGVILSFVLGFIPAITLYRSAIQICSTLILALGVYLEGGLADNKIWQLRAAQLEAKVAQAEAKAAQRTVEIQEKVVEKIKVVNQRGRDVIKYVDREVVKVEEVVKFIERCPIPVEIIDTHNRAVEELNAAAQPVGKTK